MKTKLAIRSGAISLAAFLFLPPSYAQNVGIGVSNPQSALSVNGSTSGGGLAIGDSTYTSTAGTVAPVNGAVIQGNVGIGSSTPTEAKLVVNGVGTTGSFGAGEFFNNNSGPQLVTGGTASGGWSIFASSGIVALGDIVTASNIRAVTSFTPSDIRLKNIVGRSDAAEDLETLEKIEITDYTMKDTSVVGTGTLKKVIAQQVEKVYPRAVSRTTDYLPDVLAVGKCNLKNDSDKDIFEIHSGSDLDLKIGDRVKLFNEKGEADFAIVLTADRAWLSRDSAFA
jgi:hypothetical protein